MKMREVISVTNAYNDGLTAIDGLTAVICVSQVPPPSGIGRARKRVAMLEQTLRFQSLGHVKRLLTGNA
jgi:hypothetical protein